MRDTARLRMLVVCSLLLMPCALAAGGSGDGDFVSLFDGKTLEGWQQHGGAAKYDVEDGTVVGTAVAGTPNSFLCTDRHFGDFVLELEFKVDDGLNSGVQIRSHVYDEDTTIKTKNAKGRVQDKR